MSNISSFLKYKAKRELVEPMYAHINMLSTIFRRNNFKPEMDLLIELFNNFDLFVKDLENNDWDQKKVSKELSKEINRIIDMINQRAKIRKLESGF